MKKLMSIILVLLCFALVLPTVLTACTPLTEPDGGTTGPDGTTAEPNNGTTAEPEGTTAEPNNGTTADPNAGAGTTADPNAGGTTADPNSGTTAPTPSETVEIEVAWHQGRIKSDFNGTTPALDESNADYKYSDVIVIPKAGTEIKFTDDVITVTEARDSTANRYDYVVSTWTKQRNGTYRLDIRGTNISGGNVSASPVCFPDYNYNKTSIKTLTYKYTSSKDNEIIRFCFKSKGSKADPKVYMTENAGVGTYQQHLDFLEESKKTAYDKNFEGKTIALFGDSYLAGNNLRGEYTWAKMIADKYGMTIYNQSIGGSTVSNYNGGNYPLVERWNNAIGKPDIIVIECGRNDSNASFGIALGTLDDKSTTTFRGALMYMIQNLRAKYPDAMIVGVTSYNSPDRASTLQYAKAMRDLFAHYGYPCIFAADPEVSGVDTGTAKFRTQYMEHPDDHSHLNYRGHMMAMPKLEAALSKCYADFLAGKYTEKEMPVVVNERKPSTPSGSGSGSGSTTPSDGTELVTWSNAFLGSDTFNNVDQRWVIVTNSVYKTSNVITLPTAGTTIVFKEKAKIAASGLGDTAGSTVFVFSSWKQEGGAWVIDKTGTNIRGDQATRTTEGEYNVWSYTTTKANEHIRLCYRSEGDTAADAIVSVTGGTIVITTITGDVTPVWNIGFVCSDSYKSNPSQRWKLVKGVQKYVYTDVITIPKAGTEISFTLPNTTPANSDIFAFSSWKMEGSEWVIDRDGANFSGSSAAPSLISMPSGNNIVYSYITSKDNENIRICYRNGESNDRPAIYIKENAGQGTFAQYNAWMAQSKEFFNSENLKGLKVAYFGDSYFAGDGIGTTRTWVGLLGEKYGMELINLAIGGSSMSNYGNLSSTNTPLVDRFTADLSSFPQLGDPNNLGNVDIILVEGGRNDSTQDLANGRHPVPLGDGATADTKTFLGAIRFMYETLHAKYPNAVIVFVPAWGVGSINHVNKNGNTTYDYAKAMVDFCAANGWYCIDASNAATSTVEINDAEYRKDYSIAPGDWSHLNFFGHRNALAFFERELDAIMAKKKNTSVTKTDVLPVVWNSGWVHSDVAGNPGQIDKNVTTYLYTTVFTVAKAGTTIYFTDLGGTNENVYALSHWKYHGECDCEIPEGKKHCPNRCQWVLDTSKAAIRYSQFGTAANTAVETVSGGKVYKYTTTEDNEVIRLSVNGAGDPSYIVVRMIEPTN